MPTVYVPFGLPQQFVLLKGNKSTTPKFLLCGPVRSESTTRLVRRTGHTSLRSALQLRSLAHAESRRSRRLGSGNLRKGVERVLVFSVGYKLPGVDLSHLAQHVPD